MKKKNFILIGISIILQFVMFMFPFIGIGDQVEVVSLPITLLISLFLMKAGLKGLYKETHYQEFNNGAILSVVGIIAIFLFTLFSPLIIGGNYVGIFEFYYTAFTNPENEVILMRLLLKFLKSYGCFFLTCTIAVFFFGYALKSFANGIAYQNIDKEHSKKLTKATKRFGLTNFFLMLILTITFFIFANVFKVIFENTNAYGELNNAATGQVLLSFGFMFMVLIPLLIINSVMYYINIIKSLILVFSTPKKIINNVDVIS